MIRKNYELFEFSTRQDSYKSTVYRVKGNRSNYRWGVRDSPGRRTTGYPYGYNIRYNDSCVYNPAEDNFWSMEAIFFQHAVNMYNIAFTHDQFEAAEKIEALYPGIAKGERDL